MDLPGQETVEELQEKLLLHTAHFSDDQQRVIGLALKKAVAAHENQIRKSGESYITHPLSVAIFLAQWKLDHQSISAALLHDVIEDTETTEADLLKVFGEEIVELVNGMSKIQNFRFETKRSKQAHNFRKMLLAITHDQRVILIKLADRLHNMLTICHMSRAKQKEIALETLEIYAPIAKRLGLEDIANHLGEISFKTLHPLRFQIIQKKVDSESIDSEKVLEQVKNKIKQALYAENLTDITLDARKKTIYSIYRKMKYRKVPFREIKDIYGICIITEKTQSCYIAFGMVHQTYKPLLDCFKDYIAIPKENGYQSLHTVIIAPQGLLFEIQIRSHFMDQIARRGIAAHWSYKENPESLPPKNEVSASWINQIVEINHRANNSIEFLEHIKQSVAFDQGHRCIYVCSPMGEVIELPQTASCIDFAYAIHTDIGRHCFSAIIDKQTKPITTSLKNGQTVQIITKKSARPQPHWLACTVTTKAQINIKQYLQQHIQERTMSFGKKTLDVLLSKTQDKATADLNKHEINTITAHYKCENLEQIYKKIATGQITPLNIIKIIDQQNTHTTMRSKWQNIISQAKKTPRIASNFITLSDCCKPIIKDAIVAELYENSVEIHRRNCKRYQAKKNLQPLNFFNILWNQIPVNQFQTSLIIETQPTKQKTQVMFRILEAIKKNKVALTALKMPEYQENTNNPQAITATILIKQREQLKKTITAIKKIASVKRIYRQHKAQ